MTEKINKKVVVIGSGFAGLSAATCLADAGYEVDLLEKNARIGGRARQFEAQGFVFDMGPSWYWMPDVFEKYFALFGKRPSDYYELVRLNPSYRIYFGKQDLLDIPADVGALKQLFETLEPGSGEQLSRFLKEAAYKYEVGMQDIVYRPGLSWKEFVDKRIITAAFRLHLFRSLASYVRSYFTNKKLIKLMEFHVLFLGGTSENIPALYSLMNYADLQLGTWYPMGGMYEIIAGMASLAEEKGVRIHTDTTVEKFDIKDKKIVSVHSEKGEFNADIVVAGADYHHVEQQILPPLYRRYSKKYWDGRVLAPSSLMFYLGLDEKIEGLLHHNLFFDEDFSEHAVEIYQKPKWPSKPLFYVCCPSKTDHSVAPENKDNLFILIPVAPDLEDDESIRDKYYNMVFDRMENILGKEVKSKVIYKRSYAHLDFMEDYNAFKGNAYGLANTLRQTAILKPSIRNRKLDNLYYTGQLTVPGPGIPPSLISGQIVAKEIVKNHVL